DRPFDVIVADARWRRRQLHLRLQRETARPRIVAALIAPKIELAADNRIAEAAERGPLAGEIVGALHAVVAVDDGVDLQTIGQAEPRVDMPQGERVGDDIAAMCAVAKMARVVEPGLDL